MCISTPRVHPRLELVIIIMKMHCATGVLIFPELKQAYGSDHAAPIPWDDVGEPHGRIGVGELFGFWGGEW